eukprot:g1464.t1
MASSSNGPTPEPPTGSSSAGSYRRRISRHDELMVQRAEREALHAADKAHRGRLDTGLSDWEVERERKDKAARMIQSWCRSYIGKVEARLIRFYGQLRQRWTRRSCFHFLCSHPTIRAAGGRDTGLDEHMSIAQVMLVVMFARLSSNTVGHGIIARAFIVAAKPKKSKVWKKAGRLAGVSSSSTRTLSFGVKQKANNSSKLVPPIKRGGARRRHSGEPQPQDRVRHKRNLLKETERRREQLARLAAVSNRKSVHANAVKSFRNTEFPDGWHEWLVDFPEFELLMKAVAETIYPRLFAQDEEEALDRVFLFSLYRCCEELSEGMQREKEEAEGKQRQRQQQQSKADSDQEGEFWGKFMPALDITKVFHSGEPAKTMALIMSLEVELKRVFAAYALRTPGQDELSTWEDVQRVEATTGNPVRMHYSGFLRFFNDFDLWHGRNHQEAMVMLDVFICSSPGSQGRGKMRGRNSKVWAKFLGPQWGVPDHMHHQRTLREFSSEQKSQLHDTFDAFDEDGSGELDEAELNEFARVLNENLSKARQQQATTAATATTGGKHEKPPHWFLLEIVGKSSGGELFRMLKAMDRDGDGMVSFEELEWAVHKSLELTTWIQDTTLSLPEFVNAVFFYGALVFNQDAQSRRLSLLAESIRTTSTGRDVHGKRDVMRVSELQNEIEKRSSGEHHAAALASGPPKTASEIQANATAFWQALKSPWRRIFGEPLVLTDRSFVRGVSGEKGPPSATAATKMIMEDFRILLTHIFDLYANHSRVHDCARLIDAAKQHGSPRRQPPDGGTSRTASRTTATTTSTAGGDKEDAAGNKKAESKNVNEGEGEHDIDMEVEEAKARRAHARAAIKSGIASLRLEAFRMFLKDAQLCSSCSEDLVYEIFLASTWINDENEQNLLDQEEKSSRRNDRVLAMHKRMDLDQFVSAVNLMLREQFAADHDGDDELYDEVASIEANETQMEMIARAQSFSIDSGSDAGSTSRPGSTRRVRRTPGSAGGSGGGGGGVGRSSSAGRPNSGSLRKPPSRNKTMPPRPGSKQQQEQQRPPPTPDSPTRAAGRRLRTRDTLLTHGALAMQALALRLRRRFMLYRQNSRAARNGVADMQAEARVRSSEGLALVVASEETPLRRRTLQVPPFPSWHAPIIHWEASDWCAWVDSDEGVGDKAHRDVRQWLYGWEWRERFDEVPEPQPEAISTLIQLTVKTGNQAIEVHRLSSAMAGPDATRAVRGEIYDAILRLLRADAKACDMVFGSMIVESDSFFDSDIDALSDDMVDGIHGDDDQLEGDGPEQEEHPAEATTPTDNTFVTTRGTDSPPLRLQARKPPQSPPLSPRSQKIAKMRSARVRQTGLGMFFPQGRNEKNSGGGGGDALVAGGNGATGGGLLVSGVAGISGASASVSAARTTLPGRHQAMMVRLARTKDFFEKALAKLPGNQALQSSFDAFKSDMEDQMSRLRPSMRGRRPRTVSEPPIMPTRRAKTIVRTNPSNSVEVFFDDTDDINRITRAASAGKAGFRHGNSVRAARPDEGGADSANDDDGGGGGGGGGENVGGGAGSGDNGDAADLRQLQRGGQSTRRLV